jgi:hypothetical protein
MALDAVETFQAGMRGVIEHHGACPCRRQLPDLHAFRHRFRTQDKEGKDQDQTGDGVSAHSTLLHVAACYLGPD